MLTHFKMTKTRVEMISPLADFALGLLGTSESVERIFVLKTHSME